MICYVYLVQSDRQPRPRVTLALVSLLALATVAALIRVHPPLTPAAASRGDDLALATAWAIALAASTWLFLATGSCLVALGLARPR